MNRFLQTFTIVVGILVPAAITAQAASKVNVGELTYSSATGEKRSPFKPKKTSHERSEMQAMSSKLRLKSNNSAKVPSRVSMRSVADQEIPVIYGNVIDSYELIDLGLYQLPRSEEEGFEPVIMDIEGERGGVALNGTYYITTDDYDGGTVRGYSLNSGEVVYEAEVPYEQVPITLCFNPADSKLYGIFNPEEYTGEYVFANIDYSTDTPELTPIGTVPEGVYTALSCDAMGNMYVLRDVVNEYYEIYDSEFLKVDVSTGALSLIGNVGYFSEYDTSGCIDPATGRMFYAMCTFEVCSLIEIDVKTGHGTELLDFPSMEEVVGMYCPMAEISGTAPAIAEDLHLSFENGSLSGKVTFTAPSTLYDGSDAASDMEYHVICNNEEKTGSLLPGASADVEFSFSEPGRYLFRVYLSNESGDGPAALAETFVGEDIPGLPSFFDAVYSDGKMTLKWNKPEVGENGGYIDVDKIAYRLVQLSPEEKLLEESIKDNSAEVSMEAPEEKTTYIYAITLNYGEQEIGTINSNAVILGSLLPPYSQDFSGSDSMNDFTVLDVNGDDETWTYFGNCVRIRSNSQLASDDWLILPGIKLTEGKTYGISWRSWCAAMGYPEKMEVMVGLEPTAQAMTTSVLEPTVISNLQEDAMLMDAKFSPTATGVYYVGFHAVSDADSYFLYLTDVSVVQTADLSAPSSPMEFKVTPDVLGNPSAEISFTVPSVYVNGEAMDAPDEIKVMCDGNEIKLYEKPAAGT
ncbi:MAG: choice-of-anchor J domain-containing protein, partial [Muribaculaceae bacterium]|nr:choice-of-anchor J domain-containing protein [Muribaculaceae bacterium]